MDKNVTLFPAANLAPDTTHTQERQKKRVCAYCRMGSGDICGINRKLNTQYYEWYIKSQNEWSFAGIFFDEGTAVENRNGFQRMFEECRQGNIDIIITKSVSRFSRNLQDCLTYVKELREIGVAVFFEMGRVWSYNEEILAGLFALDYELQDS